MITVEDIWPEWHTEERLGSGAFGTVWRASNIAECAVKIIEILREDVSVGDDSADVVLEERAQDVLREIEAMYSLRDVPNVVHVEDYRLVALPDGTGYVVAIRMELLDSLTEHLRRMGASEFGCPDPYEVARMGTDVCRALEACHARALIHRDVKPGNVFWSEVAQAYKLGDFGVARHMERETAITMSRKGTNAYMAPEVYFGRRYAANVDTYSLGIMMYRMLNRGRLPFAPLPPQPATDRSVEEAIGRRLSLEELPPPVEADDELARIVCRAAAPVPGDRYSSAGELRASLEEWLEHASSNASSEADKTQAGDPLDSGGQRLWSRRSVVAAGVALAAAGFGLGAWWATHGSRAAGSNVVAIAAGDYHSVGVLADGTCVACGNDGAGQCDVRKWEDVVAVAAGSAHSVGLRDDGTCVACGSDGAGQCDVSEWSDVVAVAAGSTHTVGLRSDGTCVACGSNDSGQCDVAGWANVTLVTCGANHTVGVLADGTCVACGEDGMGQCGVGEWKDVISLAAGPTHTVGLCADGEVLSTGSGYFSGMGRAGELGSIDAVFTGTWGTVGLRADGTVSVVGSLGRTTSASAIEGWSEVVAVAVGDGHVVGLTANGNALAAGSNSYGQCDVADW